MLWTTARRVSQRLTYALCFIGMFLLLPMMLLTTADVFGRAVWARPIPGTVELSSYMLAVFVLLGIAYTHQVKGHVRVSILVARIPERAKTFLDVITTLMSLGIIVLLAWQGWVVAVQIPPDAILLGVQVMTLPTTTGIAPSDPRVAVRLVLNR